MDGKEESIEKIKKASKKFTNFQLYNVVFIFSAKFCHKASSGLKKIVLEKQYCEVH